MTCAESKEVFNHVLDTVLDGGNSSSLKRSLIEDGITDIFDLITVTDDVIDSLAYEDLMKRYSILSRKVIRCC
jgi:hypothetical protein